MAEHKQFPPWIQNALGVALGTAILGVAFAAWNDRALDARRDERLNHLEAGFTEFRKPGKRYAQVDADRDRKDSRQQTAVVRENLRELKSEFSQFRNGESRAAPEIKLLKAKIDDCHDITYGNRTNWVNTTLKINEVAVKVEALQHAVYPRINGYGNGNHGK